MMEELLLVMRKAFELPDWYELTENASMENCDRWDSLSHLRMILAVEEHFQVMLPGRANQYVSVKGTYQGILEAQNGGSFVRED